MHTHIYTNTHTHALILMARNNAAFGGMSQSNGGLVCFPEQTTSRNKPSDAELAPSPV